MPSQRKIKRNTKLSKKEEERLVEKKKKDRESFATRLSRLAIIVVLAAMVIALVYTIVLYAGN